MCYSPRDIFLFLEVSGRINPAGGFYIRKMLQIAVPVIQFERVVKEVEAVATRLRTNSLHLMQEKSFVELNSCLL